MRGLPGAIFPSAGDDALQVSRRVVASLLAHNYQEGEVVAPFHAIQAINKPTDSEVETVAEYDYSTYEETAGLAGLLARIFAPEGTQAAIIVYGDATIIAFGNRRVGRIYIDPMRCVARMATNFPYDVPADEQWKSLIHLKKATPPPAVTTKKRVKKQKVEEEQAKPQEEAVAAPPPPFEVPAPAVIVPALEAPKKHINPTPRRRIKKKEETNPTAE
jgi:hypothetical protein